MHYATAVQFKSRLVAVEKLLYCTTYQGLWTLELWQRTICNSPKLSANQKLCPGSTQPALTLAVASLMLTYTFKV